MCADFLVNTTTYLFRTDTNSVERSGEGVDARQEHGWTLEDPFAYLQESNRHGQFIPPREKNPPDVFRFEEWERLVDALDPFYRPIAEVMVMTGMIASELAGFRKTDIEGDVMRVRRSVVAGVEKQELKNRYRRRDIPITHALRERLDVLVARATGDHLFTLKTGRPFNDASFRRHVWTRAFSKAGLPYRKPYTTRHTFVEWSLLAGVHPEALKDLMGHSSRQMVYEVYGKYRQGLAEDRGKIVEYLGPDFISLQR